MDNLNLQSFLKLGFYLDFKNPFISFDFSNVDKERYRNVPEHELIEEGIKKYTEAFEKNFVPGRLNVVPLSGGIDSRTVLAFLLRFTDSSNIASYTFGIPGSYDYEIGKLVADKLGIKHKAYSLKDYEFTLDKEIDFAERTLNQIVLFQHAPVDEIVKSFGDAVFWAGFMGGRAPGSYVSKAGSENIEQAKKYFFHNSTFVRSTDLVNVKEHKLYSLLEMPDEKVPLSIDEQIDFLNRQLKYIFLSVSWQGVQWKTPYTYKSLFDFWLSVPDQLRKGTKLYTKIILKEFPDIFSIKNKVYLGLPFNPPKWKFFYKRVVNRVRKEVNKRRKILFDPGLNYIDYATGIRKRPDLKNLIKSSIDDLKKRHILDYVNIDKLWSDHISGKSDYSDALLILTSLEIHLKAGKKL